MKTPKVHSYSLLFLVLLTVFSLAIKLYDPLRSPVLAALDPWGWTILAREFSATHKLPTFFTQTGYPPTFMYLIVSLATLLHSDQYDIVRYIPIISALNVIAIYMFTFEIFKDIRISVLASLLTITTRFYFMRTSIGVPEGLAHFFVVFVLLFTLRALTKHNWSSRILAAISVAACFAYYHFTLLVLVPFLLASPAAGKSWDNASAAAREIVIIGIPGLVLAGVVWFFQVLPNMIHYYLGENVRTYSTPIFAHSLIGLLRVLAYSTAKSGAVALGELGYAVTFLSIAGVVFLLLHRRRNGNGMGLDFLMAYLFVLIILVLVSRIAYNLGLASAGDSSVYFFSWLALPASIFAAYAALTGISYFEKILHGRLRMKEYMRAIKLITIFAIVFLSLVNLSSVDYYKAPAGGGLIPNSHYYYRAMTDQEYYALEYVRGHTTADALILVVGVAPLILTYQAIVAERTMVSISNVTLSGQTIQISGLTMLPDLHSANLTLARLQQAPGSTQQIFVVVGIKDVNLEVARTNGLPPPSTTEMERFFIDQMQRSYQFNEQYHNDQITVLQVLSTQLQ